MTITATRFYAIDPGLLTAQLEDQFFTDLKTHNNTFKRTASDRFSDLDDRCVGQFAQAGSEIAQVLDIGVSSGSTTLALHSRLTGAGHRIQVTGTDISLAGYLVQVAPGLRTLVDEQGHPLQYELLGRSVRAWRRRADYFSGMAIVRGLLRAASKRSVGKRIRYGGNGVRKVRLLSPRLTNYPDISIQNDDIFQYQPAFAGRFDFIRAGNVLNHGYFDTTTLCLALANIVRYLSGPGAWLLVARSHAGKTAATLFRLTPDGHRLMIIERIGQGSEIEGLVLSTRLPRQRAKN